METPDKKPEEDKPTCCRECARFWRDPERPGHGACDEFAVAGIHPDTWICHQNIGWKRRDGK